MLKLISNFRFSNILKSPKEVKKERKDSNQIKDIPDKGYLSDCEIEDQNLIINNLKSSSVQFGDGYINFNYQFNNRNGVNINEQLDKYCEQLYKEICNQYDLTIGWKTSENGSLYIIFLKVLLKKKLKK